MNSSSNLVTQLEVLSTSVSELAKGHQNSVLTSNAALNEAHLQINNLQQQIQALQAENLAILAGAEKTEKSLRHGCEGQITNLRRDHNVVIESYRADIDRLQEKLLFWQDTGFKLLKGKGVLVSTNQDTILAQQSSQKQSIGQLKTKLVEKIKKVWHRTKWFFSLLGSLVLGALKGHTWSKTQVDKNTGLYLSGIPFFTKPAVNTTYISLTDEFEYGFLQKEMRNAVVNVPVKDFEPITRDKIGKAVQEIEKALREKKEVVLFSKAGVQRCAAVAIAYLMKKNTQDKTEDNYGKALKQITDSRPQTCIDWRTKREINTWHSEQ